MESMLAHVSRLFADARRNTDFGQRMEAHPNEPVVSSPEEQWEWTFTGLTTTEGVCLLLAKEVDDLRAKLAVKGN